MSDRHVPPDPAAIELLDQVHEDIGTSDVVPEFDEPDELDEDYCVECGNPIEVSDGNDRCDACYLGYC